MLLGCLARLGDGAARHIVRPPILEPHASESIERSTDFPQPRPLSCAAVESMFRLAEMARRRGVLERRERLLDKGYRCWGRGSRHGTKRQAGWPQGLDHRRQPRHRGGDRAGIRSRRCRGRAAASRRRRQCGAAGGATRGARPERAGAGVRRGRCRGSGRSHAHDRGRARLASISWSTAPGSSIRRPSNGSRSSIGTA